MYSVHVVKLLHGAVVLLGVAMSFTIYITSVFTSLVMTVLAMDQMAFGDALTASTYLAGAVLSAVTSIAVANKVRK